MNRANFYITNKSKFSIDYEKFMKSRQELHDIKQNSEILIESHRATVVPPEMLGLPRLTSHNEIMGEDGSQMMPNFNNKLRRFSQMIRQQQVSFANRFRTKVPLLLFSLKIQFSCADLSFSSRALSFSLFFFLY